MPAQFKSETNEKSNRFFLALFFINYEISNIFASSMHNARPSTLEINVKKAVPHYMRVVQKVLSSSKILDLLYTLLPCMGLTCTEMKTDIWFSFYNLISDSMLLQQKCSVMSLLSKWGLEHFEQLSYSW